MKIIKISWMTQRKMAEARRIFKSIIATTDNQNDIDAAKEGLACLKGETGGRYLNSIIHNDHPDRRRALELLDENSYDEEV